MTRRRRFSRARRGGCRPRRRRLLLALAVLALAQGICAVLPEPSPAQGWDAALEEVVLTGDLQRDLVAVAESQLGYEESRKDYIVTDSGRRLGYTRYGDWYGIPYGDWCAMFASFCLSYAGADSVPLESSCQRWIGALREAGLFHEADGFAPLAGDLVFFDQAGAGQAGHMGIVALVTDSALTAIEGNSSDRVQAVDYALDDQRILGYARLPSG